MIKNWAPCFVRLHQQLKYFVVNKISTDSLWRNTKVEEYILVHIEISRSLFHSYLVLPTQNFPASPAKNPTAEKKKSGSLPVLTY